MCKKKRNIFQIYSSVVILYFIWRLIVCVKVFVKCYATNLFLGDFKIYCDDKRYTYNIRLQLLNKENKFSELWKGNEKKIVSVDQ